jgi:hypothetical protein
MPWVRFESTIPVLLVSEEDIPALDRAAAVIATICRNVLKFRILLTKCISYCSQTATVSLNSINRLGFVAET